MPPLKYTPEMVTAFVHEHHGEVIEFFSDYVDDNKRRWVKIRCHCGQISTVPITNYMRHPTNCIKCAARARRHYTDADAENYIKSHHGHILEFYQARTHNKSVRMVKIQCQSGHIFDVVLSQMLKSQTWCRECYMAKTKCHRTLITKIHPLPKIYLPDATPAQACKVIQCDPSVHLFEESLKIHTDWIPHKDGIIKTIREINKRLFKSHSSTPPRNIVTVAIYLYCLYKDLSITQNKCRQLFQTSEVTMRRILKIILTDHERRIFHKLHL